jgi:hypothetical protein
MEINSKINVGDTVYYNDNYSWFRKKRFDMEKRIVTGFIYRDGVLRVGFGESGHDSDFEETFEEQYCFLSPEECMDDFNMGASWQKE